MRRRSSSTGRRWRSVARPSASGIRPTPPDLNNLAGLLQATGRYEKAEPLYRQALEIVRETLGERHPTYAAGLNNLAGLLRTTGRSEEAEPLYRQALEIDRETLGERHPTYATHLNNLANLLQTTGRYEEAEPLLPAGAGD